MTKLKFIVAILICFSVSPAFGQYGGGMQFTFLNDTNVQMQIRFKSPENPAYDKVQQATLGRTQEFEILPGWQAFAEVPGRPYLPIKLKITSGAQFRATMQGNQLQINSTFVPDPPGPRDPTHAPPTPLGGGNSIKIKNDTNTGMRITLVGPQGAEMGNQYWVGANETVELSVLPGWSVQSTFNNGRRHSINGPQRDWTYRFYQSVNGLHVESKQPLTNNPREGRDKFGEIVGQATGISLQKDFGDNWLITSVNPRSLGERMRLRTGDRIVHYEAVSNIGPADGYGGMLVTALTIQTADGYQFNIPLRSRILVR